MQGSDPAATALRMFADRTSRRRRRILAVAATIGADGAVTQMIPSPVSVIACSTPAAECPHTDRVC